MISIIKNIKSFKYAFKGLLVFFKSENNARIHLLNSCIVILLGLFFKITHVEWLWVSLAISLVWMAEAFNTAIEKIVDLISPDFSHKAGEIKDLSAGAVLITAVLSLIIGIIIFTKYFIQLFTIN